MNVFRLVEDQPYGVLTSLLTYISGEIFLKCIKPLSFDIQFWRAEVGDSPWPLTL